METNARTKVVRRPLGFLGTPLWTSCVKRHQYPLRIVVPREARDLHFCGGLLNFVPTAAGSVHSSAAAAAAGREYRRQALCRETCSGRRGGHSRTSPPPLPASGPDPD